MSTLRMTCVLLALCLAGCKVEGDDGGGGVHSGCVGSFMGGSVNNGETACVTCRNSGRHSLAWDGNRNSSADYAFSGANNAWRAVRAQEGVVFPGGNFAGAIMNIPELYAGTQFTITTYLDLVPQEVLTSANAAGGDLAVPSGMDEYYGFITTQPFDEVRIGINGGAPGPEPPAIRIYEFCSER